MMEALLAEDTRRWSRRRSRETNSNIVPRWSIAQHFVAPLIAALIFLIVFVHFLYDAHTEPLLDHVAAEHESCTRGFSKQWCCGHRGARTLAPENTMAAFLTALQVLCSSSVGVITQSNVEIAIKCEGTVYHSDLND